jgi:hypothetical protein
MCSVSIQLCVLTMCSVSIQLCVLFLWNYVLFQCSLCSENLVTCVMFVSNLCSENRLVHNVILDKNWFESWTVESGANAHLDRPDDSIRRQLQFHSVSASGQHQDRIRTAIK